METIVAAAMDALPQRLSLREMAAAGGVSLWSLQRAFAQASHLTPVAYVQQICLEAARRDLERGDPGDTIFAVARRWGFTSPDGAFRDGYWAQYGERPSDTLKRARTARLRRPAPPVPEAYLVCRECRRRMRRLRRHLATVHGLTPEAYRERHGLPRDYPLVCAQLSRKLAAVARRTGLARHGARSRARRRQQQRPRLGPKIDGKALSSQALVERAEALTQAALPHRLHEKALARVLGVGLRTLRRAFLDERGLTAYVALRALRLDLARRLLDTDRSLSPRDAASRCGFGHYARFRRDFIARFDVEPDQLTRKRTRAAGIVPGPGRRERKKKLA